MELPLWREVAEIGENTQLSAIFYNPESAKRREPT